MIDLSGTIEENMWRYNIPGIPKVTIDPIYTVERDGWDAHRICFSTLTGTYLETGAHFFTEFPTIEQIPVENLFFNVVVIKTSKSYGQYVEYSDISTGLNKMQPNDGLLVSTGWDKNWNNDIYSKESPHFCPKAMKAIVDKNPTIVGSDMTIWDNPISPAFFVKDLLAKGAFLLAPLVNINLIQTSRIRLIVLPLKIRGVSSSPCRTIAVEGEINEEHGHEAF